MFPSSINAWSQDIEFSPRTRGCSHLRCLKRIAPNVFPAHAGMFLDGPLYVVAKPRFPRARGDVPHSCRLIIRRPRFSPRTRGCSSPQTMPSSEKSVFPAHAGMFRSSRATERTIRRFPRARGDVPLFQGQLVYWHTFSPRTRGCSETLDAAGLLLTVFPAHAGMFRQNHAHSHLRPGFPRARGDVPNRQSVKEAWKGFSPRTRGCSYDAKMRR